VAAGFLGPELVGQKKDRDIADAVGSQRGQPGRRLPRRRLGCGHCAGLERPIRVQVGNAAHDLLAARRWDGKAEDLGAGEVLDPCHLERGKIAVGHAIGNLRLRRGRDAKQACQENPDLHATLQPVSGKYRTVPVT
jgi:hypothetical protein